MHSLVMTTLDVRLTQFDLSLTDRMHSLSWTLSSCYELHMGSIALVTFHMAWSTVRCVELLALVRVVLGVRSDDEC